MTSDHYGIRSRYDRSVDLESGGFEPELCLPVLPCREVRQLDLDIVRQLGMPSLLLMENAGRSLVEALKTYLVQTGNPYSSDTPTNSGNFNPFRGKRFLILCGKGNNGGDGFVVARRLVLLGAFVHVVTTVPGNEYTGDAAVNFRVMESLANMVLRRRSEALPSVDSDPLGKLTFPAAARLTIDTYESGSFAELTSHNLSENDFDWIIDALLGTGTTGSLRSPYDQLVQWINKSGKPVFSIDLPSGLDADTGSPASDAVHATLTCTLATNKPGLLLSEAAPYVGQLVCGDIGVPIYG